MLALLGLAVLASPTSLRTPIYDTVIDSGAPEVNSGREAYLLTGPGRALLLQDASLVLAGRRGKTPKDYRLTFTVLNGSPAISSIRIIKRPWTEGFGSQATPAPDLQSASWRRYGRGALWQTPGALGQEDSDPVEGWKASLEGGKLVLTGLDGVAQRLARGGPDAFGLRIQFEGEGRLGSGDSPGAEPASQFTEAAQQAGDDLFIESASLLTDGKASPRDGDQVSVNVKVRNRGTVPSQTTELTLWMGGSRVGEAPLTPLASGASTAVRVDGVWRGPATPREGEILVAHARDASSRSLTFFPLGLTVAGATPELLDLLNLHVLPFSRFSFALEGVAERFRPAGDGEKADIVLVGKDATVSDVISPAVGWTGERAKVGLGVTSDTRDERWAIPGVPLVPLGWASRFEGETPLPASGLLGRYESARLHQLAGVRGEARSEWSPAIPKTLAFRLNDLSGGPLANLEVKLFRGAPLPGAQPLFKGKTLSSGSFFIIPSLFTPPAEDLFSKSDPMESYFTLVAGSGATEVQEVIPKWLLASEAVRGPLPALSLELRLPYAQGPVDSSSNLALGRSVADSAERFPAQLASVVDGKQETGLELASSGEGATWLEIDLGRDRLVAEVELSFGGTLPGGLQITHYGTSQSPSAATVWVKDSAPLLRIKPGSGQSLVYRGPTRGMRYIRLAILSGGPVKLTEVAVRPLAASAPDQGSPAGGPAAPGRLD